MVEGFLFLPNPSLKSGGRYDYVSIFPYHDILGESTEVHVMNELHTLHVHAAHCIIVTSSGAHGIGWCILQAGGFHLITSIDSVPCLSNRRVEAPGNVGVQLPDSNLHYQWFVSYLIVSSRFSTSISIDLIDSKMVRNWTRCSHA